MAKAQTIFPEGDDMEDAIAKCNLHLPITTKPKLRSVLMLYHNTLIKTGEQNELESPESVLADNTGE